MAKRPFTSTQPIEGETFLACAHLARRIDRGRKTGKVDWFSTPRGTEFVRPDGSKGVATLIAVCARKCFKLHVPGTDILDRVQFKGDYTWKGNAPAIREMPEARNEQ